MIKLALVGKNISHSKSHLVYKKIFSEDIHYDLIDVRKEKELPPIRNLMKIYHGINITSPYKKSYFDEITVDNTAKKIGAINCISFQPHPYGSNTDYFAIRDIFYQLKKTYLISHIFILGDGVMSKTTQYFFKFNDISYKVLSRKSGDNIKQVDFSGFDNSLVINTCSRDFEFLGKINKTSLFWDYNYSFDPHKLYFEKNDQLLLYKDGFDLLSIQAEYCLSFWGFNSLNN
ncbi:MAG: hypothetical protein OXB88_03480 [Bacteriovoracales bacterium]|nr:hypothetical protein [Bacteriovoracales bacterium]